jgi:sugar phosphate isomerase/epimerase
VILGIFARTFERPSLEGVLDAAQAHGLRAVQFNMASAGLPTMPTQIDSGLPAHIRAALAARDLEMAAVSGTFNKELFPNGVGWRLDYDHSSGRCAPMAFGDPSYFTTYRNRPAVRVLRGL